MTKKKGGRQKREIYKLIAIKKESEKKMGKIMETWKVKNKVEERGREKEKNFPK